MIFTNGQAAQKYRLNYSTARMVYQRYKIENKEPYDDLKDDVEQNDKREGRKMKKKVEKIRCDYVAFELGEDL